MAYRRLIDHGHDHHHSARNFNKAFIISILLNSAFVIFEIIYGLKAHSLALLADAGHNISDIVALLIAWIAMLLAKRKSSKNFTYGLQSATIFAALINSAILFIASAAIIFEATQRLVYDNSHGVDSKTVIYVALVGILINGISAWLFVKGAKRDLNIRGAFLHMASDAAVSLGVVISGLLILKTGKIYFDPITSLIIAIIILLTAWQVLKHSVQLSLHAVPQRINSLKVKEYLSKLPHVKSIHDLHIWAMSTEDAALTVHLEMECYPANDFIKDIERHLKNHFEIAHSTIQIDAGDGATVCSLIKIHSH